MPARRFSAVGSLIGCGCLLLLLTGCPPRSEPPPTEPDHDVLPAPAPPQVAGFSLLLDDPERHLFAVSRPFGDTMMVLVMNWSDEALGIRLPKPQPGHYELVQATTDEPFRVQTDSTGIILEIGARTVQLLQRVDTPPLEPAAPGAGPEVQP
jgi:hypothetical protein